MADSLNTRTNSFPNFLEDVTNITKEKLGRTNNILMEDLDSKIEQIGAQIEVNGINKNYLAGEDIRANSFIESYTENSVTKIREYSGRVIVGFSKTNANAGDTVSITVPGVTIVSELQTSVDLNPDNKADNKKFIKNTSTGYYVSQNPIEFGCYSLCRINIRSPKKTRLTVKIASYASYNNFNHAIVSKLDKTLTRDYYINRLDIALAYIKSDNANDFKYINFIIPGDNENHYIEIKYVTGRISTTNYGDCKFNYTYEIVE